MGSKFSKIAEDRNLNYNAWSMPYNKGLKERARELRNNPTAEEAKLWRFLRTLPIRINRQKPIDHYIVDFYAAAKKLVIEIDGSQHYLAEEAEYDKQREEALSLYGIRVIRIDNTAVRMRYQEVCDYIMRELGLR